MGAGAGAVAGEESDTDSAGLGEISGCGGRRWGRFDGGGRGCWFRVRSFPENGIGCGGGGRWLGGGFRRGWRRRDFGGDGLDDFFVRRGGEFPDWFFGWGFLLFFLRYTLQDGAAATGTPKEGGKMTEAGGAEAVSGAGGAIGAGSGVGSGAGARGMRGSRTPWIRRPGPGRWSLMLRNLRGGAGGRCGRRRPSSSCGGRWSWRTDRCRGWGECGRWRD